MNRYVLDAFAWIEYFEGSRPGLKVKGLLEGKNNEFYTSSAVIAELVSKAKRKGDNPLEYFEAIASRSSVTPVDFNIAYNAGIKHAELKEIEKDFGMIDAIVLATAEQLGAKIITGDRHFMRLKNVIFLD